MPGQFPPEGPLGREAGPDVLGVGAGAHREHHHDQQLVEVKHGGEHVLRCQIDLTILLTYPSCLRLGFLAALCTATSKDEDVASHL